MNMDSSSTANRGIRSLIWLVLIGGSKATSSQKQVILTFEYVNGTLVPVVHNSTETTSSIDTGPLIASVFLVSFFRIKKLKKLKKFNNLIACFEKVSLKNGSII
jgi:hypothetical protein